MGALKIALYVFTVAAALFFAALEMRMKRRLVEPLPHSPEQVSEMGLLNDIRLRIQDERNLKALPSRNLVSLRVVVTAKFLFVLALVIEVIVLHR